MAQGCVIAGDAPPPFLLLLISELNFALSNDLYEDKKSTPVRSVALSIELANDRAGVEFLFDAGDVGACTYDSATFSRLLVRTSLHTKATLTGWGGSGREGKGYPQIKPLRLRKALDLLRIVRGQTDPRNKMEAAVLVFALGYQDV